MAALVPNFKFTSHTRSISLPTSSHPVIAIAEQQLQRLKSSEDASTCQKLDSLRNLYECLDDLLQLPLSHQHLSRERKGTWEDSILDGSLRMLDICNTTRDAYSSMKESVHEIESSIRRKRGCDMDNEIDAYMMSKKKLNKMIHKCFKETKRCSVAAVNAKTESPLIDLINQIQEISLTTLESNLSFISGQKHSKSKTNAWSLISKFLQSKGDQTYISELQKVEAELMLLNSKKSKCNKDVLKQLGGVSSNLYEVAERLEVTFRLLLKARVSLLNILSH